MLIELFISVGNSQDWTILNVYTLQSYPDDRSTHLGYIEVPVLLTRRLSSLQLLTSFHPAYEVDPWLMFCAWMTTDVLVEISYRLRCIRDKATNKGIQWLQIYSNVTEDCDVYRI